MDDVKKRFLTNTDETGRFIVKSLTTGKTYYDKAMSEYRSFTNKYDDWGKCDYGDNMGVLGFSNYISESTIYGDWSCTTWSRKDVAAQLEELCELQRKQYELRKQYGEDSVQGKIYDDKMFSATVDLKNIGGFCADAGMVAVFLLDEVLKYNPNFDYHINRLWTTTLIKDNDYLSPQENGGRATHEIYSAKDDVLLYSNKDNV